MVERFIPTVDDFGIYPGTAAGRATIIPRPVEVDVRDFAVPLDGTTVATTAMQQAIDAVAAAGGGVLRAPVGSIKVGALTWASKVHFRGVCPQTIDSTSGTKLVGTTGTDVITMPTGTNDVSIKDLTISGGRDQIVSEGLTYQGELSGLAMITPSRSGFHVPVGAQASLERWVVRNVQISGGQRGWWHEFVTGTAVTCYFDKTLFEHVLIAGQTVSAWDVQVVSGNNCTWLRCGHSVVDQHGAIFKGGLRSYCWIDYNTEGAGESGKKARTTGTITTGTDTLTVASATGFVTGDPITVSGAGDILGRDHYSTITDVTGSVITLADVVARTVTDVPVTNAQWDDFVIGETGASGEFAPSGLCWLGGTTGGEGATGRMRYGLNVGGSVGEVTLISMSNSLPTYDPGRVVAILGGAGPLRQPPTAVGDYFRSSLLSPASAPSEFPRTVIASPPAKDVIIGLRPANSDGTGSVGDWEVRKGDAGQTLLVQARGSDGAFLARRYILGAQVALSGATPDVSTGNRFLASAGTATTITQFTSPLDGQMIYIRATNGNTTIQHGTNIITKAGVDDVLATGATRSYIYDSSASKWFEF